MNNVESYIEALKQKHQKIQQKIESLTSSPSSSDEEIKALKMEKLKIKDEITTQESKNNNEEQ